MGFVGLVGLVSEHSQALENVEELPYVSFEFAAPHQLLAIALFGAALKVAWSNLDCRFFRSRSARASGFQRISRRLKRAD